MSEHGSAAIWPVLHYDDTNAALRYLVEVLGFDEILAVSDDDGEVVHAELSWQGSGALVLGSTKHTESVHGAMRAGTSAVYVTCDDVDTVHARARDAAPKSSHRRRRGGSGPGALPTSSPSVIPRAISGRSAPTAGPEDIAGAGALLRFDDMLRDSRFGGSAVVVGGCL